MDTIFMNSEDSKTFKPHVLIFKLTDKLGLRRRVCLLLYQIVLFIIHGKTLKTHTTITNLKYQLQHGMMNFNYLMDPILHQIFKFTLNLFKKKHGKNIDNHSIRIYVNKIKNRITFKIKTGY